MHSKGRTIQIFLPFGSPRGVKIAEVTNRTVQAIFIPRNELDKAAQRKEIERVGVYYLFGYDEAKSMPSVYIGEAENCLIRLKEHHRLKEFWDVAVVFVTNNFQNQFTKTDVKFLEHLSYMTASDVSRFKIDQTVPQKSFVPEWRKVDLYDIFETMKMLLSTLGYPLFDEMRKTQNNDSPHIFNCESKEGVAKGEYTEEGFVVFKDSSMRKDHTKGAPQSIIIKREALIRDRVVEKRGGQLLFTRDYLFTSPSQAASAILGRSANGWVEWKNRAGQTLDEMKRKEIT